VSVDLNADARAKHLGDSDYDVLKAASADRGGSQSRTVVPHTSDRSMAQGSASMSLRAEAGTESTSSAISVTKYEPC